MAIGFIQDDLDLKLLVLYIMSRAAGPITFLQLLELALCDAGGGLLLPDPGGGPHGGHRPAGEGGGPLLYHRPGPAQQPDL